MPLSFWKALGRAARRGDQVGAVHIHRPHAVQESAQVAHLGLRQRLQLFQIVHAGVEIALHHLAQDLQAHLQADEALQRAIVEIAGDAHALGLAAPFPRPSPRPPASRSQRFDLAPFAGAC